MRADDQILNQITRVALETRAGGASTSSLRSSSITSFARVPPRRRSPDGSDGCASLAFSMPLGLTFALMSGRPAALQPGDLVTQRRNHSPKFRSLLEKLDTKLFSSASESASMLGGGDIPPSSRKPPIWESLLAPDESIRRTRSRPAP